MTDKQVGLFLLVSTATFLVLYSLDKGEGSLAIFIGLLAAVGVWLYPDNIDEGPKRSIFTVAAEIAGVVGVVLAVIEFSKK